MFYNLVNSDQIDRYTRPQNTPEALWDLAVKNNPDKTRLVPVQAVGFEDLRQRRQEQLKMFQLQEQALQNYRGQLTDLQQKIELDSRVKIDQYKQRHMELSHRVLRLTKKKIEVLRLKGYWISPEEDALRAKLEALQAELNKPNQFKGRLTEISSLVRMQEDIPQPNYSASIDEDSLEHITKFLNQQQEGLIHVTNVIKKDSRDLTTIKAMMSEQPYMGK